MRFRRRGFLLVEVALIFGTCSLLGAILVSEVVRARMSVRMAVQRMEIQHLMVALQVYMEEFGDYPPGGTDAGDDGNLDGPGDDLGAGKKDAPATDAKKLQLRAVTTELLIEKGEKKVGPFHPAKPDQVDEDGRLLDRFGSPYRYLADGRRMSRDPATGVRVPGRVSGRKPVIWSVGPDGRQDATNNNVDDDGNGRVDERDELANDICSWHD